MCILVTALVTIATCIVLAFIAYDKATYIPPLPDDGNMSGPGY